MPPCHIQASNKILMDQINSSNTILVNQNKKLNEPTIYIDLFNQKYLNEQNNSLINGEIKEINKLLNNKQNIIIDKNNKDMSNNLPNNIISSLTTIKNNDLNYDVDINNLIYQVDIKTIVDHAKSDKRFYKLLNLCIKYDIHLFNQYNDTSSLVTIDQLLIQVDKKQAELTKELSEKLLEISLKGPSDSWLIDIENINSQFKKKFKEMEIIIYILKHIYDDETLKKICCIEVKQNSLSNQNSSPGLSSSIAVTQNSSTNINTNSTLGLGITGKSKNTNEKKQNTNKSDKEKTSKYIAVYSN